MLSFSQDIAIILATIVLALGFSLLLSRLWPPSLRREHNDIIGWQLSVLGTTYAVIIGFMLYAVWTNFGAAEVNTEQEANSLVNVFRFAGGLSTTQRDAIQKLTRDYASTMVNEEWPAMNRESSSPAGLRVTQQLWTTVLKAEAQNPAEQMSLDHVFTELTNMTQHRRIRELQSRTKLPGILWAVLIVGGTITILSSCLFGIHNFKLHLFQIITFSLMLSLALVAVADIDRPFQGSVRVSPAGFDYARATIEQLLGEARDSAK